ncbi:SRPBCC domain-containing protein [Streptomyces sp. MBT62]|uniref:SRPBCC family protein n=1 Tax=Streptomyces sp. MBT62 TaxID=2800410 RepID=UPI00190ACF10|nr:SRPBCC domain-containing protein [Streptomyces sp. MBT62]MBK3568158.1 SRPBCC domain-containing protein [Streptomyces sp. MBT62]
MTHRFEIELETTLRASPEQVWDAIATGPGIDSWFMGRNAVEPREGGVATMDTGSHRAEATVTAYAPGKRFATKTAEDEDGRFMAFEYLIEGRDRGSTVLRVVHSGLLGDDWQDEYDALRSGWPFHLQTLVEYLAHFPGHTAEPVFAFAPSQGRPAPETRAAIAQTLSLPPAPATGDRIHAEPAGLPPLDGEVVWADAERMKIRTADAIYTFHHGPSTALIFHHLFGTDTEGAEAAWQNWLTSLLS